MAENKLRYKDIEILASGVGGIESYYILPRNHIAFDIGRGPDAIIDIPVIFLSHGHLDHSSGLPYYFSQRSLKNLAPGKVYVPQSVVEPLTQILKLWHDIEGFTYEVNIEGLVPGQRVNLSGGYFVEAVKASHRVDALGYVLFRRTQKLKKEFLSLSGEEIRKGKAEGKDLFEWQEVPVFAYSGDTTFEFVLENEVVRRSQVLALECTYIDDKRPVERARKWGHIHLDEIAEKADLFENDLLVLTHFSRRYRRDYILETIDKKLPSSLREKVVIIH